MAIGESVSWFSPGSLSPNARLPGYEYCCVSMPGTKEVGIPQRRRLKSGKFKVRHLRSLWRLQIQPRPAAPRAVQCGTAMVLDAQPLISIVRRFET